MTPLDQWKHDKGMKVGAAYGAKGTGAKQRGIRYHRAIYDKLRKMLGMSRDLQLLVEPWYRCTTKPKMCSPDSVIIFPDLALGVVIEVKLNWKDDRDQKLIDLYLPVVRQAHKLDVVCPLLVTQCLRGYQHRPLIGLKRWEEALGWHPGQPTPLLLEV